MPLQDAPGHSHYERYDVGHILTLNLLPGQVAHRQEKGTDEISARPLKLRVRVRQIQKPWTLSCGMVVEVLDSCNQEIQPTTAFLKLFDRRFAGEIREGYKTDPWTKDMEESYIKFVQSGEVHNFLHDLNNVENFAEETGKYWDDARNEAGMANNLLEFYTAEMATYRALRSHQGYLIPRLFAAVNLDLTPPNARGEASPPEELFQVKGILLEYIKGFSLSDLPDHAPQPSWQNIVDQAISIVHVFGDNEILNVDVCPRNFMVSPTSDGGYQVFMLDFGGCKFREQGESDLDWGQWKWWEDEEGAVGVVMKSILGRSGFELKYERSGRYDEWADT